MSEIDTETDTSVRPVTYRPPRISDGASLHSLARRSGALETNSTYSYLLLGAHFSDTCAVAERGATVIGFVSGYRTPNHPTVWFVWQVAVDAQARGQGIAKHLIHDVIERPENTNLREIQATVTPSNEASWALFQSVADSLGARLAHDVIFREADFGPDPHEPERLLRIGPLGIKKGRL